MASHPHRSIELEGARIMIATHLHEALRHLVLAREINLRYGAELDLPKETVLRDAIDRCTNHETNERREG